MNWFKVHSKLTALISAFLILIIIIVVSYVNMGNSSFIGRSVQRVISIVQGPVSTAGYGVKNGALGILQFRTIMKENEELKAEINALNKKIMELELSKYELSELKNLSNVLGYKNVTDNYSLVSADVIALDGSNWFNLFTINAGTEDGIYKDAVVVNGDDLIGRVLETGKNWSKVISVIDETNSVSFEVFRDMQLLGILSGDGEGALTGYMLDPEAAVIEGDILVTSGIGMYPEGINIGKVKEVVWNNDTLLKTVSIEPGAYFKNVQKVTVLVKKD